MIRAPARILIVDDEQRVRESLGTFLRDKEHEVDLASGGDEALTLAAKNGYHMVILDIRMPGKDGITVLRELKSRQPDLPVLMITAYADVSDAVTAMRCGAYDYVIKPFDPEEIALAVQNVVSHNALVRENQLLRLKLAEREKFEELVGRSPAMRGAFDTIAAVADTNVAVLIVGESGTGKELLARTVHRRSPRAEGPFVVLNCGGLPELLLQAELFGYEPGAFEGATASHPGRLEKALGGTLLLDEVGELGARAQLDLLRAIDTRRYTRIGSPLELNADVRVVATTRSDLGADVRAGRFREDLFYRLNVVTVALPSLRERREDISLLSNHFLQHYAQELGRPARSFSQEAEALLLTYEWRGNVRELANAIERAVAVGTTEIVQAADLPIEVASADLPSTGRTLQDIERRHIEAILAETEWNITHSASTLGIDRVTLYNKIKRYGLKRPTRANSR
ncbi:MAG: sigma-54-dependent Fis family transcriptional regulator [Deltaproteobacteria bacterium]|nr:sigma-54-dependent Fis family transcriptional regulator [Deltaproteobacteria bacterium]